MPTGDIIKILLQHGADVMVKNAQDMSPAMLAGMLLPGVGDGVLALLKDVNPKDTDEFQRGREVPSARKDLRVMQEMAKKELEETHKYR